MIQICVNISRHLKVVNVCVVLRKTYWNNLNLPEIYTRIGVNLILFQYLKNYHYWETVFCSRLIITIKSSAMSNQIITNESNKENVPDNEEKKIPIFSVESILF